MSTHAQPWQLWQNLGSPSGHHPNHSSSGRPPGSPQWAPSSHSSSVQTTWESQWALPHQPQQLWQTLA